MAIRKSKAGGKKRTTTRKTVAKKSVPKAKKGKSSKPNHDACYHKVKAQYKVFPSAYASGAIAKCRKRRAGKKK